MATYDSRSGAQTASGLNVLAGIWLIISPFVLNFFRLPAPLWNTLIAGIIVAIFGAMRCAYPNRNMGLSWINLLLGIWLIISPFFLPYYSHTATGAVPNSVILGIIIGLLAILSLVATPAYNRLAR